MAIKTLITNRLHVERLLPAALQLAFFATMAALVASHVEG